MVAIFWFSTDTFSALHTGAVLEPVLRWLFPGITHKRVVLIHWLVRKGAHFGVYAVLALLLMRAFGSRAQSMWRWRWALNSFLIVGVYAFADEYHQLFTLQRSASVYDSLIDMSGGAVALTFLLLADAMGWRSRSSVPRPGLKSPPGLPNTPASPS